MTDTPVVVTTSKPWYKSKTLWLNLATAALALADQVKPFLTPEQQTVFLGAVGVLNMILRFLTNQPVTVTKQGS